MSVPCDRSVTFSGFLHQNNLGVGDPRPSDFYLVMMAEDTANEKSISVKVIDFCLTSSSMSATFIASASFVFFPISLPRLLPDLTVFE